MRRGGEIRREKLREDKLRPS